MYRPEIGQDMLAAVREHQSDTLTGRQPHGGESGCHFQHPLPHLRPGQGLPAGPGPSTGASHGLLGVRAGITRGLGDAAQLITQGAARYHALDLSPLPDYLAAHGSLHLVVRAPRQAGPDTRLDTSGAMTAATDTPVTQYASGQGCAGKIPRANFTKHPRGCCPPRPGGAWI
jgi:hypothetical protein